MLTEFDEIKRSCRRRLAGHNERRRKPHLESSSSAAAAAAAASNLSFNCRISSPMRSTDAFHIHGTAADSLSLDGTAAEIYLTLYPTSLDHILVPLNAAVSHPFVVSTRMILAFLCHRITELSLYQKTASASQNHTIFTQHSVVDFERDPVSC